MDWFESLIAWLKSLWTDFTEFMQDLPILILEAFLNGIASVLNALPVPDFATDGLQSVVSTFPPAILWMMDITDIPECLAVIGLGVTFRLTRKLLTLGQW